MLGVKMKTFFYFFIRFSPGAHIALDTIRRWLENDENRKAVKVIVLCTYDAKDELIYESIMNQYFPVSGAPLAHYNGLLPFI